MDGSRAEPSPTPRSQGVGVSECCAGPLQAQTMPLPTCLLHSVLTEPCQFSKRTASSVGRRDLHNGMITSGRDEICFFFFFCFNLSGF